MRCTSLRHGVLGPQRPNARAPALPPLPEAFNARFPHTADFSDPRYNTLCGVYAPNCGLRNVKMSWGHDE